MYRREEKRRQNVERQLEASKEALALCQAELESGALYELYPCLQLCLCLCAVCRHLCLDLPPLTDVARHWFPAVQEELHTAQTQLRLQPISEDHGVKRRGGWLGQGPEAGEDDCASEMEQQSMGATAEKEESRRMQEMTETNRVLMLRIADLEATKRKVGWLVALDS